MKYRLGDICTIAKGATGIMKAVPGPYPMVTLAEDRKQHAEYQFDAAAVIVPLISSTGHGHASIKRIHYQEGKFALGTILCAVIPKDEALLNPRYLFVYLQQFKDSVLVPLMKGAANVSLPLNKLASLEIEVPTLEKQQEVIDLAHVLTGQKNDLEALLDAQEGDTVKLRQALLREAMQGQLLPQDPTDEPAAVLLKKLQAAKAATGKGGKGKAGALFVKDVEAVEGPFEIPANWVWARLGEVTSIFSGITLGKKYTTDLVEVPYLRVANVQRGFISTAVIKTLKTTSEQAEKYRLSAGDILVNEGGDFDKVGRCAIWNGSVENCIHQNHLFRVVADGISNNWIEYAINSDSSRSHFLGSYVKMTNLASISKTTLTSLPIPLPPLAEQHRIVAKLQQLLQHCDALEQRIRESRRLAEQLLQTALREALAPPAGPEVAAEEITTEPGPRTHRRGAQLALTDLFE